MNFHDAFIFRLQSRLLKYIEMMNEEKKYDVQEIFQFFQN